jgi:hypothetical protein
MNGSLVDYNAGYDKRGDDMQWDDNEAYGKRGYDDGCYHAAVIFCSIM